MFEIIAFKQYGCDHAFYLSSLFMIVDGHSGTLELEARSHETYGYVFRYDLWWLGARLIYGAMRRAEASN